MSVAFYMDHHVKAAITQGLRQSGDGDNPSWTCKKNSENASKVAALPFATLHKLFVSRSKQRPRLEQCSSGTVASIGSGQPRACPQQPPMPQSSTPPAKPSFPVSSIATRTCSSPAGAKT